MPKDEGAAGVDGIGIAEFKAHRGQHWPTSKAEPLAGEYIPRPVRRVDVPKPHGRVRTPSIPTPKVQADRDHAGAARVGWLDQAQAALHSVATVATSLYSSQRLDEGGTDGGACLALRA